MVVGDGVDPYGTPAFGTPTSPFGYSGQYTDTTTGLVNDRARYYQPGTGGFTTRDPAFAATDTAYTYAGGDPVNQSDPSGLMLVSDGGGESDAYYAALEATLLGIATQQAGILNEDAVWAGGVLQGWQANSGLNLQALTSVTQGDWRGDYNTLESERSCLNSLENNISGLTTDQQTEINALYWTNTFAVQRLYVLTHHLPTPQNLGPDQGLFSAGALAAGIVAAASGGGENPVQPYEVGTYSDLKARSQVGDQLDIHHVPQGQPASQVIGLFANQRGVTVGSRSQLGRPA